MNKYKEPTSTTLVMEALVAADDFLTMHGIAQLLADRGVVMDVNHLSAALYHLRKHCAVDMIEGDDRLWWYATPDTDDRRNVVNERAPERGPRRPRRKSTRSKP